MLRYFTTLIAGLLVTGLASAEPKQVLIRFHGQSFFEIESSKGTRIVCDPHEIEQYGRKSVRADLITISHYHNDHTALQVVENRDKAKLLVGLKGSGKKVDWNLIDEQFRDVRVRTVGVYHDTVEGMERGKNAVFVFEIDGLRIVHLGDLGHTLSADQVKEIGPVDVLMVPVGGVYTLNGSDAKRVVEQLKPRQYVIPMHFGTKEFDSVLPPDEFLEDQKPENVKRERTNRLTVETDFKPTEPVIVVLNWK